jgi:hypothetical protein
MIRNQLKYSKSCASKAIDTWEQKKVQIIKSTAKEET